MSNTSRIRPEYAKSEVEMEIDLEQRFNIAMMSIYQRAWDEANYRATHFHQMLREHGGIDTVQILLLSKHVSEDYTALSEKKRLDLTVEALILDPQWHDLFTDADRDIARKRLQEYGYF